MTDIRSEVLLLAAGRAVFSALHEPLEKQQLSLSATAALRLLQIALEPYGPLLAPLPDQSFPDPPPGLPVADGGNVVPIDPERRCA